MYTRETSPDWKWETNNYNPSQWWWCWWRWT